MFDHLLELSQWAKGSLNNTFLNLFKNSWFQETTHEYICRSTGSGRVARLLYYFLPIWVKFCKCLLYARDDLLWSYWRWCSQCLQYLDLRPVDIPVCGQLKIKHKQCSYLTIEVKVIFIIYVYTVPFKSSWTICKIYKIYIAT